MHDPGAFATQPAKCFGENRREPRCVNADQLARRPRRIQERPEQIENGPNIFARQPFSHLRDGAIGRMIFAGKNKTDAEALGAFLQFRRWQCDLHPKLFEDIRAPGA